MSLTLGIIVVIVFALGLLIKYLIFKKEKRNAKDTKFWRSSIMMSFVADVIIIFLGHFVAMGITEWDNDVKERERAVFMLEEARDFVIEQYEDQQPYFDIYREGGISIAQLEIYTAIDLEYFRGIVSDESVMKHLNTKTHGMCCNYINYLEVIQEQIGKLDYTRADLIESTLWVRQGFYGKLIRVLDACVIDAEGDISEEERVRLMELLDAEKTQEHTYKKPAEDYLIDREALEKTEK